MKFKTIDFTKETNKKSLDEMEKEILKYKNFKISSLKDNEKEEFELMLEDFIKMQGEYGFFSLVIDTYIPNDCMYYYNRKPSYIILSLLMQNGNPEHEVVIQKALDGCLLSKFVGHGYEATIEQMSNLLMLLESGLLYYANKDMWNLVFNILTKAKNVLQHSKNETEKKLANDLINYFKGGNSNERN